MSTLTATAQRFSHVAAGAGETYDVVGELLTFKVTQADSAGACLVLELCTRPGAGVPLHTHPSAESFTVLEGAFEFSGMRNDEPFVIRAAPGDTVFIPAGAAHSYRAIEGHPARTVVVLTPGTEMERFFTEAGTRVEGDVPVVTTPDFPALLAIAAKHGIAFAPPPEA